MLFLTADQVRSLSTDNVVSEKANGFNKLGINPISMDGILDDYLYRHRPYGQYSELTESAKDI